ncbi:MAG: replication-relaxation family protein [Deltaproteobacteria bacterium]|nr:replication-relaxation family protein [Deltaproteobacteria bacterium]
MRQREQRQDPGGARLTPRDLSALALIARAQPVTTAIVAAFARMSVAMARRRLRVMRDLGVVNVHAPSLSGENLYLLAPRGRSVLEDHAEGAGGRPACLRGIGRLHLAHHLAGVRLYVALAVAADRARSVNLLTYSFECELRRAVGDAPGVQVPDGVAVVVGPGGRLALAVEVDRGTENPSYVVRTKAIPYAYLSASGTPLLGTGRWVVGFVVPSERRRNRLVAAFHDAAVPDALFYWITDDGVCDRTILVGGWTTVKTSADGETATLVEASPFATVLTKRSDGDHGHAAESASDDAALALQERRE